VPTALGASVIGIGDVELVVAGGKPLVFYFDLDLNRLYCVRSLDETGGAWSAPLMLAEGVADTKDSGDFYQWTYISLSALVHDGKPIVFYTDTLGRRVALPANDPGGTSWGFPFEVPSQEAKPGAVRSVGGNLAFVYEQSEQGADGTMTRVVFSALY
jgi:hypothetical protein